jgi:hypothetical protein
MVEYRDRWEIPTWSYRPVGVPHSPVAVRVPVYRCKACRKARPHLRGECANPTPRAA